MNKAIYLVILGALLATCAFSQCNQPYQISRDGKCMYMCHDNPIFHECTVPFAPLIPLASASFKVCGYKDGAYQAYASGCQACKMNAYAFYSGDCTCNNIVCGAGQTCLKGNCIDAVNNCGANNACEPGETFCAGKKCVRLDFEPCTAAAYTPDLACDNKPYSFCSPDNICTKPNVPACNPVVLNTVPFVPCKERESEFQANGYQQGRGYSLSQPLTCSFGACVPYKGPACLTNQVGVYQCPLAQQTCYSGTCYPTSVICTNKPPCPQGQVCDPTAQVCKIPCDKTYCNVGQICQANQKCVIPCGTTTCNAGSQICVNNMCVTSCGSSATTPTCADSTKICSDTTLGYCATACPSSSTTAFCNPLQTCLDDKVCQIVCDYNHPCPTGYTCQLDKTTQICVPNTCAATTDCPTDYTCYTANKTCILTTSMCSPTGTQAICKIGQTCSDTFICVVACTDSSTCPVGQTCSGTATTPATYCADFTCTSPGEVGDGTGTKCPVGYTCVSQSNKLVCIASPLVCGGAVCASGQSCVANKCVAKCGSTYCAVGQKCINGACSSFCATNVYCNTATQKCVSGSCFSKCSTTANCKFGQICTSGGACVAQACTYSQDCTGSQMCISGNCVASYCTTQTDCAAGYTCTADHQCLPATQVCGNTVCSSSQQCVSNACVAITNYCTADTDCQSGYQCVSNRCVAARCGNQYCNDNEVCTYGYCVNPCSLVACPWRFRCDKGNCVPDQPAPSPSPQFCNQYMPCLGNYRCIEGRCMSDNDQRPPQYCNNFMPCPNNYRCFNYQCMPNAPPPSPTPAPRFCNQYTNCGINYQCVSNQCVPLNQPPAQTCSAIVPCPAGSTCQANVCVANRIKCPQNPCPLNYTCINNLCQTLEKGAFCSTIRQCQSGEVCVGNVCRKLVCFNDYDCFGYTCSTKGQCIPNSF